MYIEKPDRPRPEIFGTDIFSVRALMPKNPGNRPGFFVFQEFF